MSNKTIKINPDFFKVGGKSSKNISKKNTTKRESKKKDYIQHKKTKKELLEKIKQFQKENKEKNDIADIPTDKSIITKNDDINESIDYLDKMMEKRKHKAKSPVSAPVDDSLDKQEKIIIHEPIIDTSNINIISHKSDVKIQPHNETIKISQVKPDPPYGILKKGKKPTFSQYFTLKHSKTGKPNSVKHLDIKDGGAKILQDNTGHTERKEKLKTLQDKAKQEQPKKRFKKFKITKTTKTYKVGKHEKNRSVCIMLKNNDTKKKVSHDIQVLRKTHIRDIKKYLKKKNLIKFTSSTPEYILRDIYMNSMLSGDVENSNKSNLIYNYLNETI